MTTKDYEKAFQGMADPTIYESVTSTVGMWELTRSVTGHQEPEWVFSASCESAAEVTFVVVSDHPGSTSEAMSRVDLLFAEENS